MSIEELASVTRKILNAKMTESTEAYTVISVPLGDYKDAKNGFPKIRLIYSELSPKPRILKILDFDRIGDDYELAASYIPDYERVSQYYLDLDLDVENETRSFREERIEHNLEDLAGQDENMVFRVTVQNKLANALGRDKVKRKYDTM